MNLLKLLPQLESLLTVFCSFTTFFTETEQRMGCSRVNPVDVTLLLVILASFHRLQPAVLQCVICSLVNCGRVFFIPVLDIRLCLQCFDAVGWAAGRASGL